MSVGKDRLSDALLIARCLARNNQAWHLLYRRYHARLLRWAGRRLGPGPVNQDLAEEIAGRVWCSLLAQDGLRLRAYDPRRGRWSTYLAALVRQELQEYYRSRFQAGRREVPFHEAPNGRPASPPFSYGSLLDEFAATLTPLERRFFTDHLLDDRPQGPPLSPANFRKLKQRVLARLHAFLYGE